MDGKARIIDGKETAATLKKSTLQAAQDFEKNIGRKPKLVVVLVGRDPASHVYVKSKIKNCAEVGFDSHLLELEESTSQSDLLKKVQALNEDPSVDGILVQLPLPAGINAHAVADAISPEKDVDCLTAANQGLLFRGTARVEPCTPSGVIHLLRHYQIPMEGKRAVVLGRSEIVGKPMVHLLLKENATVTWLHSRSKDAAEFLKSADIVVAAVGKPKLLKVQQFKKGAVLIDVGIHRLENGLCGDIDFTGVDEVANAYTPVPGGVGPMTIAMLLRNTLELANQRLNKL